MSEQSEKIYFVLAYYLFEPIENPHFEVKAHKEFFEGRDATARVYISEEGINGQLCAEQSDAEAYMEWLHGRSPFENIKFKIHPYHENVFPRLTIKYRKQLVALNHPVDLSKRGHHMSPAEWRKRLEERKDHLLLDVRNHYEWEVGHFEGAISPECDTFKEFNDYADKLRANTDPKTPVLMCCTGGIRCELYSALLMEKGFEEVHQLDGGIIGYGLQEGSKHWLGKLFVFDDRMTVPISDEEAPPVGKCHYCSDTAEQYYNCANMDCNALFLCCSKCVHEHVGCCQENCKTAKRMRPYHEKEVHKPFKRWHHYFKDKPRVKEKS